jgi:hypothetical protein
MIQQFKNTHPGEICVIVGNGPSLDETPLEKLAQKYPTFAANKIYDSASHPDFIPSVWTCIDDLMLTDCIPYLIAHPEFISDKFIPRHIPLSGSHPLNTEVAIGFSKDAAEKVFLGGTVSYVNLQIARYMGFTTALLVGMDHRYDKAGAQDRPGSKMIADGDDPDHFKSRNEAYFSKGRLYNRPELEAIERYFFPLAKQAFNQTGGKVINLTPNTAEQVFEKGKFSEWL